MHYKSSANIKLYAEAWYAPITEQRPPHTGRNLTAEYAAKCRANLRDPLAELGTNTATASKIDTAEACGVKL